MWSKDHLHSFSIVLTERNEKVSFCAFGVLIELGSLLVRCGGS